MLALLITIAAAMVAEAILVYITWQQIKTRRAERGLTRGNEIPFIRVRPQRRYDRPRGEGSGMIGSMRAIHRPRWARVGKVEESVDDAICPHCGLLATDPRVDTTIVQCMDSDCTRAGSYMHGVCAEHLGCGHHARTVRRARSA